MSTLVLAIRYPPNDFTRLQLDQVNFDSKVDNFKCDVSTKTNIPKESMELVYCGNILDDELTLSSYGLKPGVMLHVLKKKAKDVPIRSQPMSEQDIKALVIAFKTLTLNPSHRNSLQKLSRPDILENIIMITPGLSQDPVAISLIQDPELMVRLANFETVRRIVELHPALAEAANHIAATVHEEAIHSHTAGPSTSAFGLLDLLSDDDDMESSQMLVRMVRRRLASRRRSSSGDVSYIDTLSSNEEGDEWESSQVISHN
uniref:Unkown protein n=1 Tax=Riptortus pedestris TaxID=329032 RepID=R4WDG8_RIPPE|nr:unkown protein [Riptortus pedestris]